MSKKDDGTSNINKGDDYMELIERIHQETKKENKNGCWKNAMRECSKFAKETNLTEEEIQEAIRIVRNSKSNENSCRY